MNDSFTSQSGRERAAGERYAEQAAASFPAQKISARTFLVPLLFILLHYFAQTIGVLLTNVGSWKETLVSGRAEEALVGSLEPERVAWAALISSVILIPPYLYYLLRRRRARPDSFYVRAPGASHLGIGLWMCMAAMGLTSLWMILVARLAAGWAGPLSGFFQNALENYEELVQSLVGVQAPFWLQWAAVGVFVPIAEELLFRGIVQGELRQAFSEKAAIFLQAALFGLFHMNLIQSVYAFFPALAFGFLYALSRSIAVPILLHMLFNLLGGILPAYFPEQEGWFLLLRLVQLGLLGAGVLYYLSLRLRGRRILPEKEPF